MPKRTLTLGLLVWGLAGLLSAAPFVADDPGQPRFGGHRAHGRAPRQCPRGTLHHPGWRVHPAVPGHYRRPRMVKKVIRDDGGGLSGGMRAGRTVWWPSCSETHPGLRGRVVRRRPGKDA